MKAVVFHEHGDVDVLRYQDTPVPAIAGNEVLIRVKATGINRNDLWAREGLSGMQIPLPHISGSDLAGVVEAVGELVTTVRRGEEVIVHPSISCRMCRACTSGQEYFCRHFKIYGFQTGPLDGAYAEYARLPEANIIPKPSNLTFEEAASIPLVLLTVWHMLVTRARVQPGDDVLIWGAGSGIGSIAIQLARLMGARIIATAGTDEKLARARDLGADVVINHYTDDVVTRVRQATDRKGVEVVFEHVGQATWERSIGCLTWGGRLVICGNTTGWEAVADLRYLFNKQLSLLGCHQGSKAELLAALRFVENGSIRPVVDRILPLHEAADGHRIIYAGQHFGTLVLVP